MKLERVDPDVVDYDTGDDDLRVSVERWSTVGYLVRIVRFGFGTVAEAEEWARGVLGITESAAADEPPAPPSSVEYPARWTMPTVGTVWANRVGWFMWGMAAGIGLAAVARLFG